MMILTLAVLGMVLGSFAVVQPAMAYMDCDSIDDPYGCAIAVCRDTCVYWSCPGQGDIIMEFCAD